MHGNFLESSVTSFFGNLLQPGTTVADAAARIPHKTLKALLAANHIDPKVLSGGASQTLGTKLALLRGDERLGYPCGAPAPGLVESVTIPAKPMANEPGVFGTVRLEAGVDYRLVVTGTARSQLEQSFSEYDALYCFDSSSAFCQTPFPNGDVLMFYIQTDDEEPSEI